MDESIKKKSLKEAILIAVTTLIAIRIAIVFDLFNLFFELTRPYERWQLGYHVLGFIFLTFSLGILSYYKSKELERDLRVRKELEESLKA